MAITKDEEATSSAITENGNSDTSKSIKQEDPTESKLDDTIAMKSKAMSLQSRLALFLEDVKIWQMGLGGALLAILLGSNEFGRYLGRLGFEFCLRVVSWAVGIALGVGWATHVYEQLDLWQARQNEEDHKSASVSFTSNLESTRPTLHSMSSSRLAGSTSAVGSRCRIQTLEDEQTYASLMAAAGYKRSSVLRGQVIRKDQPFWETQYPLVDGTVGAESFNEMWGSTLPVCIQQSLSKWTEYIIRDFVASWYQSVDAGVKVKLPSQGGSEDSKDNFANVEGAVESASRSMVYTIAGHGGIPFLDSLYETMGMAFGNMATRMEHVNVFDVVLMKWTKALAHTFKTYRQLRTHLTHKHRAHSKRLKKKSDDEGNNSEDDVSHQLYDDENGIEVEYHNPNERRSKRRIYDSEIPVSEMAMTKEFLLTGKLHKATTFGLDVPSLLFADGTGRECGVPLDESVQPTEESVLEHRLFKTGMLRECEQDYNRVVANRMVRVLMSRADFGSPVVASLLTEIMGSCVLTPIMGLMDPAFINGWILMGINSASNANSDATTDTDDDELDDQQGDDSDDEVPTTSKDTSLATEATTKASNSCSPMKEASDSSEVEGMNLPAKDESEENAESQDIDLVAELDAALYELKSFVDLEVLKSTPSGGSFENAEWNDTNCRAAVLQLVLVIEAALLDGRCVYRKTYPAFQDDNSSDQSVNVEGGMDCEDGASEESMVQNNDEDDMYVENSLGQLLMTLTGDVEAFEERVARENTEAAMLDEGADLYKHCVAEPYTTSATERSTIRTLICAWLHSGKIYNVVTIIVQAHATILSPFYMENAFLRSLTDASDFVRLLIELDRVDVLVDTMEVIGSAPMTKPTISNQSQRRRLESKPKKIGASEQKHDPENNEERISERNSVYSLSHGQKKPINHLINSSSNQMLLSSAMPRYFDFHRNEAFSSSLRSERERRMQSWIAHFQESGIHDDVEDGIVSHKENNLIHKELHNLARVFYNGTNLIAIRDAARRKNSNDVSSAQGEEKRTGETDDDSLDENLVSLLTVETACPRRRIEVPDDDSSFLLRAQPRPLAAVGVHRDQRNHDQSFRCFAGTFEEPLLNPDSGHFAGGRFIRRCLIRYFPIDRTASIFLQNDPRKLDQRKERSTVPEMITFEKSAVTNSPQTPFLSTEFLRDRHSCRRWTPKGTSRTQSMLSSNVMESTDFTAQPRTGKAMDFVYRMSLFEKPMLELSDKKFTAHDSSILGAHRADASALEISDASLSTALLLIGESNLNTNEAKSTANGSVQMGEDGYPIIWMKFSRRDESVEIKPFRLSFVRAALMLTSARQDAQQSSLIACVKNGSAKKATKALTDARLKPTLRLLHHASHKSKEKQALLARDLKLGMNHIDREQLRRNGLLNPRYPTVLKELSCTIDDVLDATEIHDAILPGTNGLFYRIKCSALVVLDVDEDDPQDYASYRRFEGDNAALFREEWVVYRSFKEIQALHKHLKSVVSVSESSGNAVTRLSASLTSGAFVKKQRSALIPSLSLAAKIGTLGLTKKSTLKRKEHLNAYLKHLLSPSNFLKRCPEVLLFVGAFYPLPPTVDMNSYVSGTPDPLGRTAMARVAVETESDDDSDEEENQDANPSIDTEAAAPVNGQGGERAESPTKRKNRKSIYMIPSIRHKIDKVPLSQVRVRIFELLRYQFGFENASFARNRMLSGLKTVSFAVASASEFRRILYKIHIEHLSAKSVAALIDKVHGILWPNGLFMTANPPLTPDQLEEQASKTRAALHDAFPDAVRTILGQDLTKDGISILFEMLQNRVVIRSLFYMLFDMLWLEVFPEIGDVLEGCAALDIDS